MERLGLNVKLLHVLQRAGIQSLDELRSQSPRRLAMLPGIGSASLTELLSALHPSEFEKRLEGGEKIAAIERQIAEHRSAIERLEADVRRLKAERV
jgi:DNA-directed RNA polymerase alpha subunit